MRTTHIDGRPIEHDYPYDPSYGYQLDQLLKVEAPEQPEGFVSFWQDRYQRALNQQTSPTLKDTGKTLKNWRVFDLSYTSTDGFEIGGWALTPIDEEVQRCLVVGHGYGGRDEPDPHLPFEKTALLFPCSRGISRSRHPDLPSEPDRHVVHKIEDPHQYLIGGCVDDLWTGVSAALELFPGTDNDLGALGISFSGGITMLGAPWDNRIKKVHNNVPTFGQQPLRAKLATCGSGRGVQEFERLHPGVATRTLALYDAASTARHMKIPTHLACARFDPAVAPPGQFAIYNALPEALRKLFVLTAGHHDYPDQSTEEANLLQELRAFFKLATSKP